MTFSSGFFSSISLTICVPSSISDYNLTDKNSDVPNFLDTLDGFAIKSKFLKKNFFLRKKYRLLNWSTKDDKLKTDVTCHQRYSQMCYFLTHRYK